MLPVRADQGAPLDYMDQPIAPPSLPSVPAGSAWYVVHARPRCEKKSADFCRQEGYPSFLPLVRKEHIYRGRPKIFDLPLFPGYLFVILDKQGESTMRQNRYTANLLFTLDQTGLVRQLNHLRLLLQNGELLKIQPFVAVGKTVLVKSGPLRGVEGIVTCVKGRAKVVINVDILQKSVACELDVAILESV